MRQQIEQLLPDSIEQDLAFLEEARTQIKTHINKNKRQELLKYISTDYFLRQRDREEQLQTFLHGEQSIKNH
ncbi:hypothetical protein JCM19037_1879 [Geomicrobium sp. JCM 19037]|uniref:hypothetical protein n=1 Tax=Geomicrobium sp. JCM 19037 TaxID=1460634 RepID=UPI00045F2B90|nr:hypothetical protein [Geomicrobium sp. JCM 19037]GAK03544.1 hypothetical protein JCM19037_1879 [Geomicrobium sp. JCM 19037]